MDPNEQKGSSPSDLESGAGQPGRAGPAPAKTQRPHTLAELRHYVKQLLRPTYHLRKLQEDFRASVHALRNRDLDTLKCDPDSLAKAIRGRLLASYFLVGPFGLLGPVSGTYFQYWIAAHLPFASLMTFAVTIVVGNLFSIIGFQIIWAVSAKSLYRLKPPAFFNWFHFWRDILPLQWRGFQRWAAANVVLMPLSMIALSLVDQFFPNFGRVVPIGVLTPALELVFVHTSLIRLMGDLFEKESHRIAEHHSALVCRADPGA